MDEKEDKEMKMSKKILAAAAIVLPLSIGAGSALAYFTANVEASRTVPIKVGMDTTITEDFRDWTKFVTISNSRDAGSVRVRAKAFCGDKYELSYNGADWLEHDDGYLYYNKILEPGQKTTELQVIISNVPESEAEKDDFNVVVIYEQTPVEYDSDGNELPPNWQKIIPTIPTVSGSDVSGSDINKEP